MSNTVTVTMPLQQAMVIKSVIESLTEVPDHLKGPKFLEENIRGFATRLQDAINRK